MKNIVIGLILILMIVSNLYSQGIPYGEEFQINTYTIHEQKAPSVTKIKNNSFVVCWQSWAQDSSEWGVFGHVFDKFGNKIGNEFQINDFSKGFQAEPKVASLTSNKFVVCYTGHQDRSWGGIIAQLYDSTYNKIGNEFQVNTCTVGRGDQRSPAVVGLKENRFVICWHSYKQDGFMYGIFGQRFDEYCNKLGPEFQINTNYYYNQMYPSITRLSDGAFIVCWEGMGLDSLSCDIFGQIFNPTKYKRGGEILVNSYTKGTQGLPSVAPLQNGEFVICWESKGQIGADRDIIGQRFDKSGVKIDCEFQVNTFTKGDQMEPVVAGLINGGYIICWQSKNQDGSDWGVFGQLFSFDGRKIGHEFQINTYINTVQKNPCITNIGEDGYVVCWQSWFQDSSRYGIYGKIFTNEPINHKLQNYSLIEPKFDATLRTTRPNFRWYQPCEIIECYPWELTFNLYIDTDINFSNPQIIRGIQDTTYTIDSLAAGKTYFWKVLAKNLAGDSLWSKQQDWGFFIKSGATLVENADNELPQNFELFQNYPNPFNSSTKIRYCLPNTKANYPVQLKIYDVLGRSVKVLVDQEQSAGSYAISWDGTDLGGNRVASGVYFYSLEAGEIKSIRKMLVLQ